MTDPGAQPLVFSDAERKRLRDASTVINEMVSSAHRIVGELLTQEQSDTLEALEMLLLAAHERSRALNTALYSVSFRAAA